MSSTLVVYRNDDVAMQRPFRLQVPASVDTLAELCQYLTSHVQPDSAQDEREAAAATASERSHGRGYRFLYSLSGTPLWRVRECTTAGRIVVSQGPGFTPRLPSITAASQGESSFSQPQPPPPPSPSPRPPGRDTTQHGGGDAVAAGDHAQARLSITVSTPLQKATVSGSTTSVSPDKACTRDDAEEARAETLAAGDAVVEEVQEAAKRLFREVAPTTARAADAGGSQGGAHAMQTIEKNVRTDTKRPTSAARAGVAKSAKPPQQAAASEVVYVGNERYVLPAAAAFLPVRHAAALQELVEDDAALQSRLRLLLMRKWRAFAALQQSQLAARELLDDGVFARSYGQVQRAYSEQQARATKEVCPWRVIVRGPPRSGVSTTCALLAQKMLGEFARGRPLYNVLLLPLDFATLLGLPSDQAGGGGYDTQGNADEEDAQSLLALPAMFQLLLQVLFDAIAVQRPALRNHALLLAELWSRVMTRTVAEPPCFATFAQAAAIVGHKVLQRWDGFVQKAYPLLRRARAEPDNLALRNVAVELMYCAVPGVVAAALRFSGVCYVLDSLELLARRQRHRVQRPHADAGVLLRCLWHPDNDAMHVLLAWPTSIPRGCLHLPWTTHELSTLHLFATAHLQHDLGYPRQIICNGTAYPLDLFLGAPGYLAVLAGLLRQARSARGGVRPVVQVAISSRFLAQRTRAERKTPYVLRVDSREVGSALEQLQRLLRLSSAAAIRASAMNEAAVGVGW